MTNSGCEQKVADKEVVLQPVFEEAWRTGRDEKRAGRRRGMPSNDMQLGIRPAKAHFRKRRVTYNGLAYNFNITVGRHFVSSERPAWQRPLLYRAHLAVDTLVFFNNRDSRGEDHRYRVST